MACGPLLLLAGVAVSADLGGTSHLSRPRALPASLPGRTLLLRLCAMTLILPVLVAVFGILSVYGRRAGWPHYLTRSAGNGSSRPTVCRASCWRTSFQYADGDPPAAAGAGAFPASSGKLPPSLACAAMPSSASSNGRGCAGTFRRRRADFMLCFASFATVLAGRRPESHHDRAGYLPCAEL